MTPLKPAELRGKARDELMGILLDLRRQQFAERMKPVAGGQEVSSPNKSRVLRRNIARVITIMSQSPAVDDLKTSKKV